MQRAAISGSAAPRVSALVLRSSRSSGRLTDGPFLDPDAPKAAFYWRGLATHSGPIDPPGLGATGARMEFEGADFHEYRDGKLVRLRIVFDMASAMRELGALPEPGTRAERLAIGLANFKTRLRRRS